LIEELNKPTDRTDTQRGTRVQNYIAASIDFAQRATNVGPLEATNWSNLGSVYESLIGLVGGVDSLAEEAYNKAAQLRPGDPTYANRIGSMYLAEADLLSRQGAGSQAVGALSKAEEAFQRAIELSPNFGLAIYNLAATHDRQGNLNSAIRELEQVAPFNSNQPGLMFELGLLYYRAGRKDNSLDALQRAVVLSPNYANARWYIALILEERGQYDAAIEHLNNILENNPNNEVVLQKLEDLQNGVVNIPPESVIDQQPLQ